MVHHVVLIPGFFAFAGLGELQYWTGVDRVLQRSFQELGLEVDITEIQTLPTASIRFRAAKVVEAVERLAMADDGPIHLIGHSTGGLDARLAVIPSAALPSTAADKARRQVASIVTIATPHFGTPLAATFGSVMGQGILHALSSSAVTALRHGKRPLSGLLRLGGLISRIDDVLGFEHTIVDQLYAQLLGDFSDARRAALIAFLEQVSHDRALVVQLTPDSLDLFNATTGAPEDIAYGSVVTRGRPPTAKYVLSTYRDAYAQALYLLYTLLWTITARSAHRYYPTLATSQEQTLRASYGALPSLRDNDGMAPTLSQVWGEVIHAADADHLDVMGQFGDLTSEGVHADWLPSGSGFDVARFTALWYDVARFVTRKAREDAG